MAFGYELDLVALSNKTTSHCIVMPYFTQTDDRVAIIALRSGTSYKYLNVDRYKNQ